MATSIDHSDVVTFVAIIPALGAGQAAGAHSCRGQSVSVPRSTVAHPFGPQGLVIYGYDAVDQPAQIEAVLPLHGDLTAWIELCGGATEMQFDGGGVSTTHHATVATKPGLTELVRISVGNRSKLLRLR